MNTTNLMGPGFVLFDGPAPGQSAINMSLQAQTPVLAPMMCLEWVVIDIETFGNDPGQCWEWVRRNWWPNEDWKPETMAKRLVEAVEKKTEKLALLDSAEIVTVQVKTSAGMAYVFHALGDRVAQTSGRGAHNTERDLLQTVAQWLELNCGEGTTLVGWNINGFDLPRLRLRMVKNGIRVPRMLLGMCGVLDLMREFGRNWSVERSEFIALSVALDALGVENHKKETDGSLVSELIERKEFERLMQYCIDDVEKEAAVFKILTGQV